MLTYWLTNLLCPGDCPGMENFPGYPGLPEKHEAVLSIKCGGVQWRNGKRCCGVNREAKKKYGLPIVLIILDSKLHCLLLRMALKFRDGLKDSLLGSREWGMGW